MATWSRVVRMRPLTAGQAKRLQVLRHLSTLLDSGFEMPVTGIRFGLDPIVGLFPVVGDLVSPLFTIGILWQSRDLNIPRVVQLRMLMNVAIDTFLGIVPIAGDLFDVAWKANDRNMALLDAHASEVRDPSAADWMFVLGMIGLLLAVAAVPFLLAAWAVRVLQG